MLTTLKATVEGEKLHWEESPGDLLLGDQPVPVLVTILNGTSGVSPEEQSHRRVTAVQKLAALNALSEVEDPVKWQRETREDRDLPGRE